MPKDRAGRNLSSQLTRSVTSSAFNYGEVQGAESKKDQVHKLSICLKELKESGVALRILKYIQYGIKEARIKLIDEVGELSAIIASIINKKKE